MFSFLFESVLYKKRLVPRLRQRSEGEDDPAPDPSRGKATMCVCCARGR
jgi:hypothetical protein